MRQPPLQTVYISFMADINMSTAEVLVGACFDQINRGASSIYLLFSTPGGFVANGIALYQTLKGLPIELTIHNTGAVDSIGNAVFLAGKNRYASPNSTFMYHGVGFNAMNNQRFEEKLLRESLDGLLDDQRKIADVIAKETTLKREQIDVFFRETQTKDADFALQHGIIHEIREVALPKGVPLLQLVFSGKALNSIHIGRRTPSSVRPAESARTLWGTHYYGAPTALCQELCGRMWEHP